MDTRRLILYLALGLILFLLWNQWQAEHPSRPVSHQPAAATVQAATPASTIAGSPAAEASTGTGSRQAAVPSQPMSGVIGLKPPSGPSIRIHTDVLDVTIALKGGVLTQATLLKYPRTLHSKDNVDLLSAGGTHEGTLMLRPELRGSSVPESPLFTSASTSYHLVPGQNVLRVPLSWHGNGVTLTRVLVFKRDSYQIGIETQVKNATGQPLTLVPGVRLFGTNPPQPEHFWDHFLPKYYAYRGPAYYNQDSGYEKSELGKLAEKPLDTQFKGGWIASVKQYFVAAAIPPAKAEARYFGRTQDGRYEVGYNGVALKVSTGINATTNMTLFLGPKKPSLLKQVAPGLPRTVNYGYATIISKPIFAVLSFVHRLIGNWGWSIVILVLLIKALFYFPQRMSARSMAKMRKLQPRMKLLRERYKDDRQKLSQATMELYREEGVNPVSGCLPMLIQVPIFIGLFEVLLRSVELRQAPWMLWIQDLSQPDPFFVLPIVYAVLSFVQFRLQPQATDNAQAKMMMVMPLLFAFFYALFPSGLVLYYTLSTGLNIAIQYQVNREMGLKGLGILPKINWPGGSKSG